MTGQNQNEQFAYSAGTFTLIVVLWFPGSYACVVGEISGPSYARTNRIPEDCG